MNKFFSVIGPLVFVLVAGASAHAADSEQMATLNTLFDSARVAEANVFAPKLWEKANEAHKYAKRLIDADRNQKEINKKLAEAIEYAENCIRAAEVAKVTLQEYLTPRNNARKAKAYVHAPDSYAKAEEQFMKATKKVEDGDVKGALKEAEKSVELFNTAEMVAIEIDILGKADRLIEKAVADEADKYALSTLDKAKTAREKADAILLKDRYNREESLEEARRAEFEAMHASNIALSVRSLERNDQAWEKLMLVYEIQMSRVADSLGIKQLPFDQGPLAAADAMITKIRELHESNENLAQSSEFLHGAVADQLKSILTAINEPLDSNDPVAMGKAVETALVKMQEDEANLKNELESTRDKLATLQAAHEEVQEELGERVEKEQRFVKAKQILNPSEGEILYNSSNDVVLRLSGLSFDVGQSSIKDEHIPLLEKVKQIIQMFPDANLIVEGHTDASGDPSQNMLLSEKRAYAVTQYLRQSLLIPADKIKSMGFGMEHPIASNQTEEGRSKNRRIDIIIQE